VYTTSIAVIALSVPANYLPIFQPESAGVRPSAVVYAGIRPTRRTDAMATVNIRLPVLPETMAVGWSCWAPVRCPHCRQIVTAAVPAMAVNGARAAFAPSPRCADGPFGVPATPRRPIPTVPHHGGRARRRPRAGLVRRSRP